MILLFPYKTRTSVTSYLKNKKKKIQWFLKGEKFMQDKKSFGKYIAEKRKEANLTQEELAQRLYVIPTTISKWERGITYPDISVITSLCKELNISEHEFFTACDDEVLTKEKKEIRKYRAIKKGIFYFINLGYLIAIITCFICNLAIDHKLSWSLIALCGILISASITTLPFYLSKDKYLFTKITTVFTLLIYSLLVTIHFVTNENYLLPSIIIATFVLGLLWISVILSTLTKINIHHKISLNLILLAICTITINPFCSKILNVTNDTSNIPNIITSIIMVFITFVIEGKYLLLKTRR